jgi:hypothetical protein
LQLAERDVLQAISYGEISGLKCKTVEKGGKQKKLKLKSFSK